MQIASLTDQGNQGWRLNLLSVRDAAECLGVSLRRIQKLCEQGRISAQKVGQAWVILGPMVDPRRPEGRPPKLRLLQRRGALRLRVAPQPHHGRPHHGRRRGRTAYPGGPMSLEDTTAATLRRKSGWELSRSRRMAPRPASLERFMPLPAVSASPDCSAHADDAGIGPLGAAHRGVPT